MEKLKLSEWGERIKTGGSQMRQLVTDKMKELLSTPTPESRMVDEATSDTLDSPNWGLNLRICSLINSDEFSASEVVKAIKRKIGAARSPVSEMLSLDLLEACAMNCERVFSVVAAEKVPDDMVSKLILNPTADVATRDRAFQLIRAWGQSDALDYLPVFRQTFLNLKGRAVPLPVEDGSDVHQQPMSPPPSYPVPDEGLQFGRGSLSAEEKNEFLVTTRNSVELLSSILNSETEPKPIKEDLTLSLLEKCKESQPVIRQIAESTTDDEAMLFEALSIHDEVQKVISRFEELETSQGGSKTELPEIPSNRESELEVGVGEGDNETKVADSCKEEEASSESTGSGSKQRTAE